MKVLLSWLREFAEGIEGDPFALGDVMSGLGLGCEEVTLLGEGLDGIVVARVLDLHPHPDADRIQLVDVDLGDGEALQICCGAFNMAVGDLVPLATLGTTMPGGMEIARRKLRGEWSNGMLCSARELELSDEHAGILILPPDSTPGTPITETLGIDRDVLFDLDLTPNRPDALSVVGVARDVAAKLGVDFALPTITLDETGAAASELATVEVLDPQLCGRFTARVLSGISVGASPPAIARRLTLLGMRSINSIVDISNYVMLEYGQPNHTFDLAKVTGAGLRVRRARESETLETLDGQTRTLSARDGVIADAADVAIGIAGVMGGASTEIDGSTTDVLLELAWWEPSSIAHTSKRLGLRSEASARFEKGIDPEIAGQAAARFAQLAAEAGARVHPGEIVVEGTVPDRSPILVRTERVNAILGSSIGRDQIAAYLTPIGFTPAVSGDDLLVALPTWRPDSTAEIDVIEEVARLHGYEHVAKTVPYSPDTGRLTPTQLARRTLADVLVANGVSEALPNPFLAPGELELCGVRTDGVVVANPLAAEESVLRTSLLPGLLGALGRNASYRNTGVSLFEIGNCYAAAPPQAGSGDESWSEWSELGVALGGVEAPVAVDLLGIVLEALGYPGPEVTAAEIAGLHPTRAASVTVGDRIVGEVGEIDPAVVAAHGVEERVAWFRIDLDQLFSLDPGVPQARAVSRYPSSDIDLAFVVDSAIPAHQPATTMRQVSDLVTRVELFDVYRSAQLGADRRSLAYAIRLQASDRTLTDVEVAEVRSALIDAVVTAHGAELRG